MGANRCVRGAHHNGNANESCVLWGWRRNRACPAARRRLSRGTRAGGPGGVTTIGDTPRIGQTHSARIRKENGWRGLAGWLAGFTHTRACASCHVSTRLPRSCTTVPCPVRVLLYVHSHVRRLRLEYRDAGGEQIVRG